MFFCFFVGLINSFTVPVPSTRLSPRLFFSFSLSFARLHADCTPLSLIYVPKPVVVARTHPLFHSTPTHLFASSRVPASVGTECTVQPRVHFTTLFLGFDCEINLGLARNAERVLACSLLRSVASETKEKRKRERERERKRDRGKKTKGRRRAIAHSRSISHVLVRCYIAGTRRYNYCTSHNSLKRYSCLESSMGRSCYPTELSSSVRVKRVQGSGLACWYNDEGTFRIN